MLEASKWNKIKFEHISNSLIYRLDDFIEENKHKFGNIGGKVNNTTDNKEFIDEADNNFLKLQFGVPFLHINIDINTKIDDGKFVIAKNININVDTNSIRNSTSDIIEFAHEQLSKFQEDFYDGKEYDVFDYKQIKDHLAYSYIFKLNGSVSINHLKYDNKYRVDKSHPNLFNPDKIPNIPGVIFKSIVYVPMSLAKNTEKAKTKNRQETIEIDINYEDIFNAKEEDLIEAHKILDAFIKNEDE